MEVKREKKMSGSTTAVCGVSILVLMEVKRELKLL